MGCRLGFDLTTKMGRSHFWHGHYKYVKSTRTLKPLWFDLKFWQIVFEDTFAQYVCGIKGHVPILDDRQFQIIVCKRCHKYQEVWRFKNRVDWFKFTLKERL